MLKLSDQGRDCVGECGHVATSPDVGATLWVMGSPSSRQADSQKIRQEAVRHFFSALVMKERGMGARCDACDASVGFAGCRSALRAQVVGLNELCENQIRGEEIRVAIK